MDRKWWTLIAVCVGTFMLLLDVTIVNVALPAIQSSLNASFADLQWVVDAYSLLLAALLLTTGSLADLYGRRRVFVIGLVIFTASSLGSGLAQSPLMLNLFRGAQGAGAAAMFSTSLALLGSTFQGRERGTAFGVWGAITGLAVAIGPVVGGALTTGISWRWIFLVNVPIGIVAVVISLVKVDESRQPGGRSVDPIGVVLFSGSLGALVYALIKANEKGWGSTLILCLLAGALAGLVLFVIAEFVQKDRAMFDLALFRKPTFTGGSIAAFSLSAGFFALFLYLTLYLQDVLGYSALQTGLRFLVLSGGILLTSAIAGRLTAVVPIRFLIAPGLLLVGVGLLLMRGVDASSTWVHLIPGLIVSGMGVGLINPPLASTAIGVVTPDRAGMASGINSTFRQVGIATGIAGLGSLFAHTVSTHIESALRAAPGVSARAADALAATVSQGSGAGSGLGSLPARARPAAIHAVRASFTAGLNDVFLVGAVLTLVSAALTLVLIRSRDFETGAARAAEPADPEAGHAVKAEQAPQDEQAPQHERAPQDERARQDERAPQDERARQDERAPAAENAEPVPATARASSNGVPADPLLRGVEAVIAAAGNPSPEDERLAEADIEHHRAVELAAAEAEGRRLIDDARRRSDRYAASLRRELRALGSLELARARVANGTASGRAADGDGHGQGDGPVPAGRESASPPD